MILISAVKPVRFKVGRGTYANLPTKYIDGFVWFTTDTRKLYIDATINGTLERTLINPDLDWSQIDNKPENIASIYYNTVEGWDAQPELVSEKNAMYVYTDAYEENGTLIPSIKIGDGSSYLIDIPFVESKLMEDFNDHIRNTQIHVSEEDRIRWDNKVRAYHSTVEDETIVFTTN